MGIHLFNPPDPHAHDSRLCGNCRAGVPAYWKLTISYLATTIPAGAPAAGDLILGRTIAGDQTVGRGCWWAPLDDQPQYGSTWYDWILQYRPRFAEAAGPLPSVFFKSYWVIWIPKPNSAVSLRQVYYRVQPSQAAVDLFGIEDVKADSHFRCFGPNRFYYVNSIGNEDGAADPVDEGWPEAITVEPWTP